MEDCMSFAFSSCGLTLLHHFKETERNGKNKTWDPGASRTGPSLLFVLLCLLWRDVSSAGFLKSTLNANIIWEMALGDPGRPGSVGGGCECEARTIRATFSDSALSGCLRRPLQVTFKSTPQHGLQQGQNPSWSPLSRVWEEPHTHSLKKNKTTKKKTGKKHSLDIFSFYAECEWRTATASCPPTDEHRIECCLALLSSSCTKNRRGPCFSSPPVRCHKFCPCYGTQS